LLKDYPYPSIEMLKKHYPESAPFYTQQWVYSAITALYSKNNQFDKLRFNTKDTPTAFIIKDHDWTNSVKKSACIGHVYEGHQDYWLGHNIENCLIITGHQHSRQLHNRSASIGFDFWDINFYQKNSHPALHYEINTSGVDHAVYDVVIPVGNARKHRIKFLTELNNKKSTLSIVTDPRQTLLDTDLRFDVLNLDVYLNKFGSEKYESYKVYHSFYDTNGSISINHLPHKKLHAIGRVSAILETTTYNTDQAYLTEKTYKVLSQHRPFIIFGDTNSLLKLKLDGFKTFDKFCDESYDQEPDVEKRIEKSIDALIQLVDACKKYPNDIDKICRHNQERFFNPQRHSDNLAKFGQLFLDTYTNMFEI
jgi:hypothetical protein